MGLVVGAALALFSVAIVAFPFLKSRLRTWVEGPTVAASPEAPELESIYEAIRTLRLEHELGQVPEQLYREQLQGYRVQAATALRQRAREQDDDPEWSLEQEVLAARAALRGAGGVSTPCPSCGADSVPGDGGCPECGAKPDTPGPASP
tara:strand:+ start:4098 stop:4544 length:447 start_codon:yes stop_codon:yes gene_type:complete